MNYQFRKMHGLGNDFVVLDAFNKRLTLDSERIRALADRRFGVGYDQVLLVQPPRNPDTEFHCRIFNADGSEVEQCGRDHSLPGSAKSDQAASQRNVKRGPQELRQTPYKSDLDRACPRYEPLNPTGP